MISALNMIVYWALPRIFNILHVTTAGLVIICCISGSLSSCQTHTFLDSRPGKIIANSNFILSRGLLCKNCFILSTFLTPGSKVERVARLNVEIWAYGTTRQLTARYFGHSFETGNTECDFDAAEDFDDVYCRNVNGVCVFPEMGSGKKTFNNAGIARMAKNNLFAKSSDLIWQIYCQ